MYTINPDNYKIIFAENAMQKRLAYQLRYQVYCVENAFEEAAQFPNGLEKDNYDKYAIHILLAYAPENIIYGGLRLILPGDLSIDHICHAPTIKQLPVDTTAELSRFILSYKRLQQVNNKVPLKSLKYLSCIKLAEAIIQICDLGGISHLCAVIDQTLLQFFQQAGLQFNNLGPLMNYHGLRQPCWISVKELKKVLTNRKA